MKNFLLVIILISGLASCKGPEEAPEFKYVENVRVTNVTDKEAYLNADAVFYNPNEQGMTLRGIDVDLFIEGREVGRIEQSNKIKIPASSDFKIPLDATFRIGDVGVLNTVLGMLGGKKLSVRYMGYIKVTMNGLPVRVPVDYESEVRLR
ncbi:LEA type 2 family protein [Fulvivirga sedimenti]|uniref:LEA type 2 family protein n=1 Tax=Fulvivirga sedimenti TaxID=2879465 RepID=A0A9X1HY06_9BACT|nr:LEA type 2 family protein [Fulvivirga sedimenti]MCA6078577.1 LEA type 2 family protein [Fulvivirga sedimenti]